MDINSIEFEYDCTLLVSSCDRYSDLWTPFFSLLNRYWAYCKFSKVLITEELKPEFPNVRALNLGSNLDWSSLLIKALDNIPTTYILLTLEDFFLRKDVNNDKILNLLLGLKIANLT